MAAYSRPLIACWITMLLAASSAYADFEIAVSSGTVDPNGNLLLEIGINSDTPPQDFAEFELILQITPLSTAPGSSLVFVDPQSEVFLSNADYVFADSSEAISENVSTVFDNSGSQISFYDASYDSSGDYLNVTLTKGQLLATVDLKHAIGSASLAATAGNQYQVSVSLLSGFFQANNSEVDFSFTPGIVTVGAVAIPEPSSIALLAAASCGCVCYRRRRR